jgi:hypothetical protein
VKPATAYIEGPTTETLLKLEMTAAAEKIGTSWMSTAAEPQESANRKVSNSREDSNIQHGH